MLFILRVDLPSQMLVEGAVEAIEGEEEAVCVLMLDVLVVKGKRHPSPCRQPPGPRSNNFVAQRSIQQALIARAVNEDGVGRVSNV